MKKFLSLLVIAICFSFSLQTNAQCLEKGNIMIDAYYGYPNLYSAILKTAFYTTNGTDYKASSMGPLGARFEYSLGKRIGLGLEFNYASSGIEWNETPFTYKITVPRMSIMPRFNLHVINKDKFDMYFATAIGYKSYKVTWESNDPNYVPASWSPSTVGYRIAWGMRVFFVDNLGANFELGIGGALLSGGLTAKF